MKALWLALAIHSPLCAAVVEEKVTHAGVKFRVVRVDPASLQLVWKDEAGVPYRSFDRVQAAFSKEGKTVVFIMNAGIFEPGGIPSGLHIQSGKTHSPLSLADAPGNFFLKPNGVCAFGKQPFVGSSSAWQNGEMSASWAVQSGPMLLIDGKRHPAFTLGSTSKLHRNGIGLAGGQFVLAITDSGEAVNLWDFAGLFLKLGCENALFLDGDISQMAVRPGGPVRSNQFGAMFVIAE